MSSNPYPTVQDIFSTHFFEEPLVPIGEIPAREENVALASALLEYSKRSPLKGDYSSITGFLDDHPKSAWNVGLLVNLGLEYKRSGRYSKAIDAWRQAWKLAKRTSPSDLRGFALANRAVGELAHMYAILGRVKELVTLLKSIKGRVLCGPATERIAAARGGLWNMYNRPEISFRCGPLALHSIMLAFNPNNPQTKMIDAAASTKRGFSLHKVAELSCKLGLNYQMAFRDKSSASIIIPAVVHFKLDHFAALIRHEEDRYLLVDPTFKDDVWVTKETLEDETSGYFLVPQGELPDGWRAVDSREAKLVWGKGFSDDPPDDPGPCDYSTGCACPSADGASGGSGDGASGGDGEERKGMAVAKVHLVNVSLNITDVPIGYSPPVGPSVNFVVRYNQRDSVSPSTYNYSNFGNKWTFDWLAYLTYDHDIPHKVQYFMMGGGTRIYTGFKKDPGTSSSGVYANQVLDQTKLIQTEISHDKLPDGTVKIWTEISYTMISPDGSVKIFNDLYAPLGLPYTGHKFFLTKLIDPLGNSVHVHYDEIHTEHDPIRVSAISDAIGQKTTVYYEHPTDIYKITRVEDPFGRVARFEYDTSNRLNKITDVIGLISSFEYEVDGADGSKSDFIKSMTTPYGITKFTKSDKTTIPLTGEDETTRTLEILYPDGDRERVEFNQNSAKTIPDSEPFANVPTGMDQRDKRDHWLYYRNTFHWDRQGCAQGYGDYTKARIYHWLHTSWMHSHIGVLESYKDPLEGRIWYQYLEQRDGGGAGGLTPHAVGKSNKPTRVGRVLDDGSTQLYIYEYNDYGHLTKEIDPIGRTFSYTYADNGIDLLEVRQTGAGKNELLSSRTYDSNHLLLTKKDAAGQTTTYTYNSRGQLLTETNAMGDTTTYDYDANGYRTSVNSPIPGIRTEWTYDAFGRIKTETSDPTKGYLLKFDYDDFDRLTRITYPDGTSEDYFYEYLHLKQIQDRAKRHTIFEYNSNRQMTKRTDPLNRTTLFVWCKCGALKRIIDPMGRSTTWQHDLQGRVKLKEYADGSKITYIYENRTSRIFQKIDEKLQVTKYIYNLDNTLNSKSYSNATISTSDVSFTYDPNYTRLTSMTDSIGTTYFSYFPVTLIPTLGAGQLMSEEGPFPKQKITYDYDKLGRRISTSINGGIPYVVTFDEVGRVVKSTNALGTFTSVYEPTSFHKSFEVYPNGQSASWSYGGIMQDQRLEAITYKRKDAPISEFPISQFVYEYDIAKARISKITRYSQQSDVEGAFIYDFDYDESDQLTSSTVYQGANIANIFEYTYDPAGNRQTEKIKNTHNIGKFYYNALNELTSSEGFSGYQLVTYEWDAEHRLVSIKSANRLTKLSYDGLGRCVIISYWVDDSEVTRRLLIWSGAEICEEHTQDGSIRKRFFPQGMQLIDGTTTNSFFYTRDHIGSIRELIHSETGNVVVRYDYDPFGRRTRLYGELEADFGFVGMFWLPDSGLNLTLFRAYDPGIGRWLSRDPLKDAEVREGANLFTYVKNNPVNLTDPFGLECKPDDPFDCFNKCMSGPLGTQETRTIRKICYPQLAVGLIAGFHLGGLIGASYGLLTGLVICVLEDLTFQKWIKKDCEEICRHNPGQWPNV
ncbi:MAG TPA: RHS repeat-associated core domain-containing protein [Nitrososphaeraceae archaeon]